MAEVHVDLYTRDGEFSTKLFPVDRMRDALADLCKRRWPQGTRKAVAAEFGLSLTVARTVVEGSASQSVLDHIWRHPNGGWRLVLPVFASLLGEGVDQFIARERQANAQTAIRLREVGRSLRAVASRADAEHPGMASELAGGGAGERGRLADGPRRNTQVAPRSKRGGRD